MAARLTRAKKKIAAARIPYAVPSAGRAARARRRGADRHPPALRDRAHRALGRATSCATTLDRPRARPGAHAAAAAAGRPRGRGAAGAAARPPRAPRDAHRRATAGCCASRSRTAPRGTATLIAEADRLVVGRAARRPARALHAAGGDRRAARRRRRATRRPTGRRSSTLYDELLRVWPSPVVALNRAVAVSMVDGPEAALAEVEALERDGRLAGYRYLPADQGRPAAPPRPRRRGGRRLPGGARAQRQRGRAGVPGRARRLAALGRRPRLGGRALAHAEAPRARDRHEPLAVARRRQDAALAPARRAGLPDGGGCGVGRGGRRRGAAAVRAVGHGARWRATLTGASRRGHGPDRGFWRFGRLPARPFRWDDRRTGVSGPEET